MHTYCTVLNIIYLVISVLYLLYGTDMVLGTVKGSSTRGSAVITVIISASIICLGIIVIATNWYLSPPVRVIELIWVMLCFTPAIAHLVDYRVLQVESTFLKIISYSYVAFFGCYLFGFAMTEEHTNREKMYTQQMVKYTPDYMGYDKDQGKGWFSYTDENGYHKIYLYKDEHSVVSRIADVPRKNLTDGPIIIPIPDTCVSYILTIDSIKKDKLSGPYIMYLQEYVLNTLEKNMKVNHNPF